jgi:hypothetical protein
MWVVTDYRIHAITFRCLFLALLCLTAVEAAKAQSGPFQNPDTVVSVLVAPAPQEELRPVKLGCGKERSVKLPPDPTVEVRLSGSFRNATECCNQAMIACSNKLLEAIESFVPRTICRGCTCPTCGARSCEPLPRIPEDHSIITEKFEYASMAYCEFSAGDPPISFCQMRCRLPSSADVQLQVGCTGCADGHVPSSSLEKFDPMAVACSDRG